MQNTLFQLQTYFMSDLGVLLFFRYFTHLCIMCEIFGQMFVGELFYLKKKLINFYVLIIKLILLLFN